MWQSCLKVIKVAFWTIQRHILLISNPFYIQYLILEFANTWPWMSLKSPWIWLFLTCTNPVLTNLSFIPDTFSVVTEGEDGKINFTIPYHFSSSVKSATSSGQRTNAGRARRLAQEIASLSTSLPLSYSSSVFVRCDEERLDIMKVAWFIDYSPSQWWFWNWTEVIVLCFCLSLC